MLEKRRYDIDALRSISLFLLIFFHLSISFTSLAKWILWVPNNKVYDSIWSFLSIFDIWRLPLIFLISGIALRFSYQERSIGKLFKDRFKRLGIPYVFGVLTFVPLSSIIGARYLYPESNSEDIIGLFFLAITSGGYLWFLVNILIYCILLIPIISFLTNKKRGYKFIRSVLSKKGGVLVFSIPFILEGHLLDLVAFNNEIAYGTKYSTYVGTNHGFLLGFIWFLTGILLTSQGDNFWNSNLQNIKVHTFIAIPLLINRFINDFEVINKLIAFESFNFIFLILGLSAKYLNRDSSQLEYYKTAIFPLYIVHLPVQMGVMYLFSDFNIPFLIKFPLVLFLICFLSLTIYHAVKNFRILRPLFGLTNKKNNESK